MIALDTKKPATREWDGLFRRPKPNQVRSLSSSYLNGLLFKVNLYRGIGAAFRRSTLTFNGKRPMSFEPDRRPSGERPDTVSTSAEVIAFPGEHRPRPGDALDPRNKISGAKKVRTPPKPGPTKRRADAPHRIPLNIGLQATDKMKLLRVIARDNRLTAAQKAAAIPLVDFVNSTKGHSFFSWDGLGNECDLGWQAAKRAAEKLRELGYVNIDHVEGDKVHVSLNLMMIDADVPKDKRAMSRDKAREVYGQTPPTERHQAQADDEARHVRQGEVYGGTSPGVYDGTSPEVYDGTSGGMYGPTSESEIPLRDTNQGSPLREEKGNETPRTDVREVAIGPVLECREKEPVETIARVTDEPVLSTFFPRHVLSWKSVTKAGPFRHHVPRAEVIAAVEVVEASWSGNREPGFGHRDNKGMIAEALRKGWSVEQLVAPMPLYHEQMIELQSFDLRLVRYLNDEFDVFGKQAAGEREMQRLLNPTNDDDDWGF